MLLAVELAFDAVETCHELLDLLIRLLLPNVFIALRAIQDVELVPELFLHVLRVDSLLVFLLAIDGDEVGEVGALLPLTDLNHNAHDDVLEGILTIALLLGHADQITRHMQDVVAGELAFLLQDFVLIDEEVTTEGLVLILLDQLLHTGVAEDQELAVRLHPEVHIHVVLHEKGTVIDGRTFVELLEHELVILKFGVRLDDALFNEVKSVGWCFLGQNDLVLLLRLGL